MEESLKYFVPQIEDIRVGYECEIWWNQNMLPENDWCAVKALQGDTEDFDMFDFTSRIQKNEIRVPYLTKEQIEAEGWEQRGGEWDFYKGKYHILYDQRTKTLYMAMSGSKILDGAQCKDINTFRYICKLLGI